MRTFDITSKAVLCVLVVMAFVLPGCDLDGWSRFRGRPPVFGGASVPIPAPSTPSPLPTDTVGGLQYVETAALGPSYLKQVAVLDLDGDGFQDIFVEANSASGMHVLYGLGNRRFSDPVPLFDGAVPFAGTGMHDVQWGDLNGDGAQDVVCFAGKEIYVGINKKEPATGARRAGSTFTWGTIDIAPALDVKEFVSLAHGDWNKDGKEDIAASWYVNASPNKAKVFLFNGKGDGTFLAPTAIDLGVGREGWVRKLETVDINKDGRQDLVATVMFSSATNSHAVAVVLSKSDGSMDVPRLFGTDMPTFQMAFGDMNGDGLLDIVTSDYFSHIFVLFQQAGPPLDFKPDMRWVTPARWVRSFVLVDVNRDGALDIVAASGALDTEVRQYRGQLFVSLMDKNKGVVASPPVAWLPGLETAPQNPWHRLVAADLDGDGYQDVVALPLGDAGTLTVLGGTGGPGFTRWFDRSARAFVPQQVLVRPEFSVVYDETSRGTLWSSFDGNGFDSRTGAFLQDDGLFFPAWQGVEVLDMAAGDIDGDGHEDLVVAHCTSGCSQGRIRIVRWGGTRLDFASPPVGWGVSRPDIRRVFVVDWDADGKKDIVVVGNDTRLGGGVGMMWVFKGRGALSFHAGEYYPLGVAPTWVSQPVVADFNRDGRPDVAFINAAADIATGRIGQPLIFFQGNVAGVLRQYTVTLDQNFDALVVGDVDRDGYPDLFVTKSALGILSLFKNNRAGGFLREQALFSGVVTDDLQWSDITGDGVGDLTFVNRATRPELVLLRGDGLGGFLKSSVHLPKWPLVLEPGARVSAGKWTESRNLVLLFQPGVGLLHSFVGIR